jgi:flagella basal body P-ring formation protein FlgA
VYSSDPDRSKALEQLPLGATPERPTLLPARTVQERIAAVASEAVVIGGRIALLPAVLIPEDQRWFYSALLSFIEAQDAYKQGRMEIELLNSPLLPDALGDESAYQRGMASGWEDRIVFETGGSPYDSGSRSSLSFGDIPAGTMRVSYRVLAAGGADPTEAGTAGAYKLEGSFRIWIHHYLPVARAALDLPANHVLTEESLVFSEEDVSLLQPGFILQGEAINGYRTLSPLRRGERIEGQRLQRVLAVRAGDRVMITVVRPGLRVTLPGRAFRSGSVGDVIDVRPQATTKRFRARITSQGEVLVEND